jgi:2-methylisocitrate lyase-like PEP mutase family enzyme
VKEVNGPINVVMGLAGNPVSVRQLEDLGVTRVSIGGSLARATLGLIRRSAEEIMQKGTFEYASYQIPDSELCELFSRRKKY